MATRKALDEAFEKLELQRHGLIERIVKFPPQDLATPPAAGGWSVAQVITHMAMIEEGSLAYLRKKYTGDRHRPVGAFSILGVLLLKVALASPIKFMAPATVAAVPVLSFAEATARWDTVRHEMHSAYPTVKDEHLHHDLFKHPLVGRFDLVQALSFMHAHHQRHLGQIDRILRSNV